MTTESYKLRPKPFWLRWLTPKNTWVAIFTRIYHPKGIDTGQYPALFGHEMMHLSQQREKGLIKWLFKYLTSKRFRLQQEVEAIVAELSFLPFNARMSVAKGYAKMLAGREYWKAAPSAAEAFELIYWAARHNEVGI